MSDSKFEASADYTDEELIALYRAAIAERAVVGKEYYIRDRRVVFPGVKEAMETIEWLERRIASKQSPGRATNYVRMVRR